MSTRVTQTGTEFVAAVTNNGRLSQTAAEYVAEVTNSARLTQAGIEYVYEEAASGGGARFFAQVII